MVEPLIVLLRVAYPRIFVAVPHRGNENIPIAFWVNRQAAPGRRLLIWGLSEDWKKKYQCLNTVMGHKPAGKIDANIWLQYKSIFFTLFWNLHTDIDK